MKFQIGLGLTPLQNYMLLDLQPLEGNPQFTGNVAELPCEDGECTEILAENIIGYIPPSDVNKLFKLWYQKLRKNHFLIINGIDALGMVKMLVSGDIGIDKYNNFVYSQGALHYRTEILSELKDVGFTLSSQKVNGINYTLKVVK